MHHDITKHPPRYCTHVIQGDYSNSLTRFSPIKMISYTLISKMVANYGLVDNENLLNQFLSGWQVLILRFPSPFHVFNCFSTVLSLQEINKLLCNYWYNCTLFKLIACWDSKSRPIIIIIIKIIKANISINSQRQPNLHESEYALKKIYNGKFKLLFTDTDSLTYEIETEGAYKDF